MDNNLINFDTNTMGANELNAYKTHIEPLMQTQDSTIELSSDEAKEFEEYDIDLMFPNTALGKEFQQEITMNEEML